MINQEIIEWGTRHQLFPTLSIGFDKQELRKRYHFGLSLEDETTLVDMDDFKKLNMNIEDVAKELFNYYLRLYDQRNEFYI